MTIRSLPKIPNFKIKYHISTIKQGDMLILGMDNKIAFIDSTTNVCIGEFECDGRVDSIRFSEDLKEIFMYTHQCKLYRIQKNQTLHFMQEVPNSEEINCFLPFYIDDELSTLLIANDKFRFIEANDIMD